MPRLIRYIVALAGLAAVAAAVLAKRSRARAAREDLRTADDLGEERSPDGRDVLG